MSKQKTAQKQLKIGLFLMPFGHHAGAWRHPKAEADKGPELAKFLKWARIAEQGKLDAIFLADTPALIGAGKPTSHQRPTAGFEPLTLLSAIAGHTQNIGLIATATTTYNLPYNLARQFASLDHLSGGRAGWNVVTTWVEATAANFGQAKHPVHAVRYDKALEFVDVVRGLWDSWEDDAFLRDKESAIYYDASKLHTLNHDGESYQVAGPLNVPRPPQGHPILVQAGASDTGRDAGAAIGDLIFVASPDIEDAKIFYKDVKSRAAALGRNVDQIKIMPGISPIIGRTQEEADAKLAELNALVPDTIAYEALWTQLGVNLSCHDPDGPLPEMPPTNAKLSRQKLLSALAKRDNLSIRQLAHIVASSRGFLSVVGTPEKVADTIEIWFREGAADGFNLMPPLMPGGLEDFIDLVVPILQKRGLFRTEYEGKTLRENLGLARPDNRFAAQHVPQQAPSPVLARA